MRDAGILRERVRLRTRDRLRQEHPAQPALRDPAYVPSAGTAAAVAILAYVQFRDRAGRNAPA
jgi:hypothetical protein